MPWYLYKYTKRKGRSFGVVRWMRSSSLHRPLMKRRTLHMRPQNTPDRAKGMRAWVINGMYVYAGTEGGARKLYRRLVNQRTA